MIDAAIVGIGWWGQKIVAAVQGKSTRLRFVHGVSKEPDEVRDFAVRHGIELSTELDDVLADPHVRAVVLATPHSLHTQQIVACAQAGKAVFCEKPLALTQADAARSVEACSKAGVLLGIGTNKRFWPCMRELRRVVDSGVLGRLLHVEGHYSNENTGKHFSSWRTNPDEAPAAGLTGSGIHVLDALVSYAGPARRVHAQVLSLQPQPSPLDTITVLFEFDRGLSGTLAAIRSTPFYWRIHVFGSAGSAEALGENELVVRLNGKPPQRMTYEPVDSLAAEFDAFADAVARRAAYPITGEEMIATIAAFEAVVASVQSRTVVSL
ncbi:MAG: Gfo/Idh/MocA family oxidoreductase [Burkholderiales bacterium]